MRYIITACISILFYLNGMAQERHVAAFYNVENLFDTINCPTTADEDMLPLSDRCWNTERYRTKIKTISQVLSDIASQYDFPTLIGLAEVENRRVIEDIVAEPALAAAQYCICHYDSPDQRGIDVALLYRPNRLKLKGSKAIAAASASPTRDILTAWGEIDGDNVFIAVVHWPSRIGGVKFTEQKRIDCAKQLRNIIDSVQRSAPTTKIIIMGDMNDNPQDKSIAKTLRARRKIKQVGHNDLYAPFADVKRGSSVYDGRWNKYDNIIVSENMLNKSERTNSLHLKPIGNRKMGAVFRRRYILDRHNHPQPTFNGTHYTGGASDHLPIYIIFGR